MNLIQALIKAKGLSQKELCRRIGIPYHSYIKVITRAPYYTKSGEVRFRECRYIREAIADWLGYPYDLIWGPGADVFLKRLIGDEIERQLEAEKTKRLQALGLL